MDLLGSREDMPAIAGVPLLKVLLHVNVVLHGVRIEASLQGVKDTILQGFLQRAQTVSNAI